MTDDTPAPRLLSRKEQERRKMLRSVAVGAAMTCVALAGLVPAYTAKAEPRLRPPGALNEKDFLAACIKCGQCVQVCPVQAIELADFAEGVGNGVPYIKARDQACDFSCDATQCVLACPTGALSHLIDRKEQVTMGKARLSSPENCLAREGHGFKGKARGEAFKGLLRYENEDRWKPKPVANHDYDLAVCDLCVRECPIKGAIKMEPFGDGKAMTPVVMDTCVGCGVCEMICPADTAAITIDIVPENRAPKGAKA